ncbi:MAG: type I polyketide synthase, partial [Alphaproteobacteria bacterium]|nr:type I polyketide synthase [Alphaproteobacteria bacterium]
MKTRGIGMADIAIIGMAGIFPKAPDVTTFWSNILNKVDAVVEAPPGWLGDETVFDPDSDEDTRIYTRHGGFLGPLSRFDPRPSGTMPVSILGGEPDQFLALEVADRALADAGLTGKLDGERAGIILGHGIHANRANVNGMQHGIAIDQTLGLLKSLHPQLSPAALDEIRGLLRAKLPPIGVDVIPGLVPNMMTGRIANRLDLMGPNYIIDAACASTLLSVEAAVLELRRGRADVMIAGGVNTTTSPLVYMVFCQLGALSRKSRVRPFDAGADGTVLGEGVGMVVLKRLDDALEAGDRIYAVIKAVGQSSDGRGGGLMAPRFEGEVLAMRRAYEESGIDPATIGLIEAHGTGIPLGDRTEIRSLRAVMGGRARRYPHIPIGSVKSMIGHCIPAAGSASLIKMALALHVKIVPPTLCDTPSVGLDLEDTPFYVAAHAEPWINGPASPRRAAINSFGFGGINAHLVLEEAPGGATDAGAAFALRPESAGDLVVLGQPDRPALLAEIDALIARLGEGARLPELARESWSRVAPGIERLAIVASDAPDLAKKLEQARSKLIVADCQQIRTRGGAYFTNRPLRGKVAFLFPGENSQFPGMLHDLAMAFPQVRGWFDFLEGLFDERDLPPRAVIFPPSSGLTDDERAMLDQRLRDVDAGSEAVFTADQALFGLLMAFGVRPDFMVGHSTGENAAIVASGVTGFDAGQIGDYIRAMNAIFRKLQDEGRIPGGGLLNVGAVKREALLAVVAEFEPRGLHFTMDNCPNQAILFGPDAVIAEVSARLSAEGAMCQPLVLEWPYHTPLIAPMADAFAELFRPIEPRTPIGRLFSCATTLPFPETREAFQATANAQYTSRVRFTELIGRLWDEGARLFVECGPSGHRTAFVGDILGERPHLAVAANVRRRGGLAQVMHMLAQLFVHQTPIDPQPLLGNRPDSAPARKSAPLNSELPFIRLDPPTVERMRALIGAP